MGNTIKIDELSNEIMKGMQEYSTYAADEVKSAVNRAGASVKKDISTNAPKRSGTYAKSWTVKKTKETSSKLEVTVHSRTRYQLAHLLEHGHAKRGGGRVTGKEHIRPAEEKAVHELEESLERRLKG